MRKRLAWIFTVALLTMANIAAEAQVIVIFGDDGKKEYSGKGGEITYSQTKPDNGKATITLTASPQEDYTINKDDIYAYEVISPNMTRAGEPPVLGKRLDLDGPEGDMSDKTDYSVTIDAKLGLWVKKATFNSSIGTKSGSTDYSGTYYIGSAGYNANNTSTNYYLCPTEGWAFFDSDDTNPGTVTGNDNGKPFLTTYQCRNGGYHSGNPRDAIWTIEKAPDPDSDYYYIKQTSTGRYMVFNGTICINPDRARVHLEEINAPNVPGNSALFSIYSPKDKDYLVIKVKSFNETQSDVPSGSTHYGTHGDHKWLTINQGNQNTLAGNDKKNDGPSGFKETGGIVGIYNESDANAPFYLEKATVDPPIITNNYTAENTFTITATEGATIYYTTDGSTPTTETTTTGTTSVNVTQTESMTVIKAIAKAASDAFPSVVTTYTIPQCARPVITVSGGTVTITCATEGATIHYNTDENPATISSTPYTAPFAKGDATTIRAIAVRNGYINSNETILQPPTEVSSSSDITDMSGNYILASDFTSSSSIGTSDNPFMGTIDGKFNTLTLGYPLVAYAKDATIKNVILKDVSLSSGTNVGAICNEAAGDTRIYNCGVLSGTISGNNAGSIVGKLDGNSRVVNCYSFATVSGSTWSAGIVGYNSFSSTISDLRTMVMNCMFYGEISSGTNISPVYGGAKITNVSNLNGYNYYRFDANYSRNNSITAYNCALAAEEKYLTRFEFFRNILNSNRELAAWYATDNPEDGKGIGDECKMAKWVLDPADKPYPILKPQGYYPSVINYEDAPTLGTISLTINESNTTTGGATKPTGASINSNYPANLTVYDKDLAHNHFNYRTVRLPYYNEVGTGNCTKNKVVTGWKITEFSGGTQGHFVKDVLDYSGTTHGENEYPPYNFADRYCTDKDKYSVSGRVFSQGAYYDVPEGVTGITIEPYWGTAVYLSDPTYDVAYPKGYGNNNASAVFVSNMGDRYVGGDAAPINGDNQTVYTTYSSAFGQVSSSGTVYDNAIVLVGNYHHYWGQNSPSTTKAFTVMSADLNNDCEPDYSFIVQHGTGRQDISAIRFDFINSPGLGMIQKVETDKAIPKHGIWCPKGWFEVTNTTLIQFTQFEYDKGGKPAGSPLILLGGIYDQFITARQQVAKSTEYIHLGSNIWMKEFCNGVHTNAQDSHTTRHIPISVTGGEFESFYLTGTFRPSVNSVTDNAECYINGGKFGDMAGAGQEQLKGDVTWLIDHADITNFYGGGINDQKPVTGHVYVEINNSQVGLYCGGPKFGNMSSDKKVTTKAKGSTFGNFYGAGYGGTSYFRDMTRDVTGGSDWDTYVGDYTRKFVSGKGISTEYEYEFIPYSGGQSGQVDYVGRFYVLYASLSLAETKDVESTLEDCHITGSFYGGGKLGRVDGSITSTLNNCIVGENVFGAGFSASVEKVNVVPKGAKMTPNPAYNESVGVFTDGVYPDGEEYTWTHAASVSEGNEFDNTNQYIYTTVDLTTLGTVTGDVTLNINGTTTVGKSVYGGGEESDVLGNTRVEMTDGYVFNGIFGGGLAGSVGTFTRSTEEAYVNIFGHTTHDGCIGKPVSCAANTGKCTVVVTGGQIGPIEVATLGMKRPASQGGPVPEGWVWGGGCGIIEDPDTHPDTHFKTYVGSTDVTIGGEAFILESIIGGGEFGRVLGDTHVTIQGNCQIGVGEGQTEGDKPKRYAENRFIDPTIITITNENALPECSHFEYGSDSDGDGNPEYLTFDPYYDKYYDATSGSHKDNIPDGLKQGSTANACDGKTWIGCVFGGGSGYYPYEKDNGTGYGWVRSAGWVEGNTSVEITGGHILTNVYGANEYTDVKGKSTVRMSGGTVGVPRTLDQIKANPLNGNIFGAGKGDPRTYFNEITNVGSTEVEITGGIIYGSVYGGGEDGHVTGNAVTTIGKETTTNEVITKTGPVIGCVSTSDRNGNVFGGGMGAVSALTSGVVGGNVTLGIVGGQILGSVYGGGQIASVGSHFTDIANENYGKMQAGDDHGCLTVNLTGGTIDQNVYGGCMGANADASKGVTEEFAAKLGISKNVVVNLNQNVDDNAQGCAVKGSIFGCNNVNSSPEGTVEVHVYGTQYAGKSQIANTGGDNPVTDAKTKGSYDVHAVYGGGNLAAYIPKNLSTGSANVIIDGCGRTSIQQVYGGGNAASTPATSVTVNGTFEIEEVFGGGNGKDAIGKDAQGNDIPNPGANVGFYDYSAVEDTYPTKEDRQAVAFTSKYVYGSGKASVNIFGGTIHRVFGGSNTKGNVRQTAVTLLEEAGGCDFCVDEAYGGGKSAPMDAEAKLLMSCIPGLQAAYGGAEAADILGNVTLNITNGTFDRVFGGNNLSGTISGSITVNIEEVGCKPVKIGELYGGGNQAAYSVYGYDNGTIKESGTRLYNDPVVNVKSFTSIGSVFGGGYGEGATLVGNPTVNINEVYGKYYNDDASVVGENAKTSGNYPIPSHAKGKMGAINNVFGGGNAARVIGNTTVNIGTRDKIDYVTTESGESTPRTNITVVGADIRSNVYGGGNNAEVTGNAKVVIGKKKTD